MINHSCVQVENKNRGYIVEEIKSDGDEEEEECDEVLLTKEHKIQKTEDGKIYFDEQILVAKKLEELNASEKQTYDDDKHQEYSEDHCLLSATLLNLLCHEKYSHFNEDASFSTVVDAVILRVLSDKNLEEKYTIEGSNSGKHFKLPTTGSRVAEVDFSTT